jgi:WD40 repeat protein
VLSGHTASVWSVAMTEDGTRALSASWDGTARVWNLASGACEQVLVGHRDSVWSIAVAGNGHRAVSGSEDGSARVWDLKTGHCEQVLQVHTASVSSVAVSAGGSAAVTVSRDGTAGLWNLDDGALVNRWADDGVGLVGLATSPFLVPVVCGDERGGVHIFDIGASGQPQSVH